MGKAKESSRKKKLAALKARTEQLKQQAKELATKSLMAAAQPANETEAAEVQGAQAADGGESELGMAKGHDTAIAHELINDAEQSEKVAQRAEASEKTTKHQLKLEREKVRQLQEQKAHKRSFLWW